MASIKVKFRPSQSTGQKGSIYYRITHERQIRHLRSENFIYSEEWDEKRGTVIRTVDHARRPVIEAIREKIHRDMERFKKIILRLEHERPGYTAEDIVEQFREYMTKYSLFHYMESMIKIHRWNGKVRTSEAYTSALNSFRRFREDRDVMLDSMDTKLMESYSGWLHKRNLVPNTISFYIRILRAVYNRAVEAGIIDDHRPFRRVYTGIERTIKRALPLKTIIEIKSLDLSSYPAIDYARDMFLLSFMLRGMSFIDMAFLKKSDLIGGFIEYRRRKTGQRLVVEWTKEMQHILNKYPVNESEYLLPIIKERGVNERCVYRNVGYNINHNLKSLAEKINIPIPLTLYVARHSWASVARTSGIPVSVISEGLGHESEMTTRIYLSNFDSSIVDKANKSIIRLLDSMVDEP